MSMFSKFKGGKNELQQVISAHNSFIANFIVIAIVIINDIIVIIIIIIIVIIIIISVIV